MVSAWPELPNAKCADARCGVQGTFAAGGIKTPTTSSARIRRGGFRVAPTLFGRPSTSHAAKHFRHGTAKGFS